MRAGFQLAGHALCSRVGRWMVRLMLVSICGAALASTPLPSFPDTVDATRLDLAPIPLAPHFELLEDASLELTLDDVRRPETAARFQAKPTPGKSLNLGFSQSAWWLRLQVSNPGDHAIETMLEITVARLAAQVDFHSQDADGRYQSHHTGYLSRFSERLYPHHFYVFPVALAPRSVKTVYLRLHSPAALNVPARLWEREAFHQRERNDYGVQTVYFGMALAMAAFNLLLFFALRDFNYLLYVGFVCSAATAIAANNGMAIEYLVGEWPVLANASTMMAASITLIMLLLFMRRMLATPLRTPRLDRVLKLFVALHAVLPVGLALSFGSFLKVALMTAGATAVLILATGVICSFKRDRIAVLFTLAFSVLCLSGLMNSFVGLGLLPANVLTDNGVQMGSAIEMVLLAFALADRYNVMRREKAAAQRLAFQAQAEALHAEQRVAETLKESEHELEQRVKERTAELSATVTRLKQTQGELVQAEKLASLGALVAGVAHELNTPIGNAVTTASSLQHSTGELEAHLASGEIRKSELAAYAHSALSMAELIGRSCRRAATLIASFKQVAVNPSIERRQHFNLHALVEDCITLVRSSNKNPEVRVENAVATDIEWDSYPGPLGQVLSGLIQNALLHAFEGRTQGRVRVQAQVEGDALVIKVKDDGLGMAAEVLPRIFDPFFTTRLGHGGSGLGLSIALNVVTGVLGGTLDVESQAGRGSRFVVRIRSQATQAAASGVRA
jgi:signal transduction histidine kinase